MEQQIELLHRSPEGAAEKNQGPDFSEAILSAFARFTRTSPEPKFLIDRSHRIIAWNPAMEDLARINSAEVIGKVRGCKDLFGSDWPSLADLLVDNEAGDLHVGLRGNQGETCPRDSLETTIFSPGEGDSGRWLHFSASAVRSPAGYIIGALETVTDITVQMHTDRELTIALRKLRLMGDVAWHEIQNKITGIRGYVELSKDVVQEKVARTCIDAEEHVLRQIHDLLQCTREYQEIGNHPPRWIGVRDKVSMVVSLVEDEHLRANLEVGNLELFADPVFETMISHLIRYSVKRGKTCPEIWMHFVEKADSLELIYEDNGPPIPENKKSDMFPASLMKHEDFCMIFVHDVLEFSGMTIQETGNTDRGVRFVISVPKGRYRFA
jgi:hypothetical protein